MFITDRHELRKYASEYRVWQGIPSIEVTKKGRIFSTFYSGEEKEKVGNFAVLVMSDDGISFTEPVAVAYEENQRCFDPCIWIDPLDRLWFTWTVMPKGGVWGVICEAPDAEELVWSSPFLIGREVMMNKPTVLTTGEWLFPIAAWDMRFMEEMIQALGLTFPPYYYCSDEEPGVFVYESCDCGKSFRKLGGTCLVDTEFCEHSVVERKDKQLVMFVRTKYGVGVARSDDKGRTWTEDKTSAIYGPGTRFHVQRLKSGRILMVYHVDYREEYQGRNNLMAMLSDDDCKTWKYRLMLDPRNQVSYPDSKEADDGYIYITYDRERGAGKHSMDEVYASAREILYARITEEDIMAGKLTNEGSRLQCVISKLDHYKGADPFR